MFISDADHPPSNWQVKIMAPMHAMFYVLGFTASMDLATTLEKLVMCSSTYLLRMFCFHNESSPQFATSS